MFAIFLQLFSSNYYQASYHILEIIWMLDQQCMRQEISWSISPQASRRGGEGNQVNFGNSKIVQQFFSWVNLHVL